MMLCVNGIKGGLFLVCLLKQSQQLQKERKLHLKVKRQYFIELHHVLSLAPLCICQGW